MNKKIITAIVGSGTRAHVWAREVKKNKNFELKYCSSENSERALDFSKNYNCKYFLNTETIMNEEDVDLFIISNSPSKHLIAVEIAKKKKNIILEKPISLNSHDLELIYESCKKNKILCAAGLNRHYDTFLPLALELINNKVGKCFHAEYTGYFKKNEKKEKLLKENYKEHENIMFGLIHKFDQANYLFGKPISVSAVNLKSNKENVILQTNVSVKYNNTFFNFSTKNDCNYNYGENINLYCENGMININFNLGVISASSNPLNYKISRSILSKFKQDLIKNKKFFKYNKKKILEEKNFSVGGPQDILISFNKVLFGESNINFADIENNYITTKMALACNDSIITNKWVKI
jgi:predicted dehydrogenase